MINKYCSNICNCNIKPALHIFSTVHKAITGIDYHYRDAEHGLYNNYNTSPVPNILNVQYNNDQCLIYTVKKFWGESFILQIRLRLVPYRQPPHTCGKMPVSLLLDLAVNAEA